MPFEPPYPYGTEGGFDDPLEPQIPEVWRLAKQTNVIVYLHVNGVLTEKDRQNVEDVIRVLDLTGVALVAIIIRDDGTIIDNAVGDVNAGDGLAITLDAPGVVTIRIPVSGIDTAMIADLAITAAKIANDTITATQIAADAIGTSELAPGAVTNTEVAAGAAIAQSKLALAITNNEIAVGAAIAKSKLAALNITNADIDAAAAIAKSKLAALNIVNADVAAGAAIDGTKLGVGTVPLDRLVSAPGGGMIDVYLGQVNQLGTAFTNQAAGEVLVTRNYSTWPGAIIDLDDFTEFRVCVFQAVTGGASSVIRVKGDKGIGYESLGAATTDGDCSMSGTGLRCGSWTTLKPAIRVANVDLTVAVAGGDSAADPNPTNVRAYFR